MNSQSSSQHQSEPPPESSVQEAAARAGVTTSGSNLESETEAAGDRVAGDLDLLREKAQQRDEYLDLLQRTRADYANYQKRIQKQLQTDLQYALQPLVTALLPVLDNLDRALAAQGAANGESGILQGVEMVARQLRGVLEAQGVREIAAEGQPFDPHVHEAVMQQPDEQTPPNTVLRVFEPGYRLHDRVIRPAKVVVSVQSG